MPKRGQHDHSPGDARKPYSDEGGPRGHHEHTHDVRREEATNPAGPDEEEVVHEAIAEDTLHPPQGGRRVAAEEKDLVERLDALNGEELDQLTVLLPGTPLHQGSTYLDLDGDCRPFVALGRDKVRPGHRYVAKHDVDYVLWHHLLEACSS